MTQDPSFVCLAANQRAYLGERVGVSIAPRKKGAISSRILSNPMLRDVLRLTVPSFAQSSELASSDCRTLEGEAEYSSLQFAPSTPAEMTTLASLELYF